MPSERSDPENTSGNRPQDESKLIGLPIDEAPKISADQWCNSKKWDHDEDGNTIFVGYCRNRAGKGTNHVGNGRCKHHGGCKEKRGAPEGNQNAQTHALYSDIDAYYDSLDEEGKQYIENVEQCIVERIRKHTGDVDPIDRILAHRVAIEIHIVFRATDYTREEGLTRNNNREKSALLSELRQYDRDIMSNLNALGVFEERNEDKLEIWRDWIEGE